MSTMTIWGIVCLLIGVLLGAALTPDFPGFAINIWGILSSVVIGVSTGLFVALWAHEAALKIEAFNYLVGKAIHEIDQIYTHSIIYPGMSDMEKRAFWVQSTHIRSNLRDIGAQFSDIGFEEDHNIAQIASAILHEVHLSDNEEALPEAILRAGNRIKCATPPLSRIWTTITWREILRKYLAGPGKEV